MALKERLTADTKAALLSGDRFVAEVLRGLKAAILNEEVAKGLREQGLDDAAIEAVIAREVKKRAESLALYEQNNREDLADVERREMAVLVEYLPQQLSEAELSDLVDQKITELGVSGPAAMGQIIGAIKSAHGATVDGGLLARIVKQKLT